MRTFLSIFNHLNKLTVWTKKKNEEESGDTISQFKKQNSKNKEKRQNNNTNSTNVKCVNDTRRNAIKITTKGTTIKAKSKGK
jgi:hypothetical protein